jgi:hypothetical protein
MEVNMLPLRQAITDLKRTIYSHSCGILQDAFLPAIHDTSTGYS